MSWTKKVCCVCLKLTNLQDVNQDDVDNISYLDKIKSSFSIDLFNEELSFLCEDCIMQLRASFNFVKLLKESQNIIKGYAEEVKIEENCEKGSREMFDLYDDLSYDSKTDITIIKQEPKAKKIQEYTCKACDKVFKNRRAFSFHLKTHSGEKSYKCTYCDKKFYQISTQKRHIKSHEQPPGSKAQRTPFLCTICGKKFPYSNTRNRHMKTHLGIKSHECSVCMRKFNQSTHLKVHMRTHTGERPYICEICGKTFSLNSSLQKHKKQHESQGKDSNLLQVVL